MFMEVKFEPYKSMVFKSYLPFDSAASLIESIVDVNTPGTPIHIRLLWANGILIRFYNQAKSEALSKEYLSGNVIFDHIEFAPMKEYIKNPRLENRPMITVDVLDVSKHTVFNPLTAWIRDNLLSK
jgi:hypothetical protein